MQGRVIFNKTYHKYPKNNNPSLFPWKVRLHAICFTRQITDKEEVRIGKFLRSKRVEQGYMWYFLCFRGGILISCLIERSWCKKKGQIFNKTYHKYPKKNNPSLFQWKVRLHAICFTRQISEKEEVSLGNFLRSKSVEQGYMWFSCFRGAFYFFFKG